MKQNNTNMLFKSLALCFLILGNLTFEVLCVPAAAVTVVEGDVAVPKKDVCTVINKHYKMKSTEDFFKKLVSSDVNVTEYKFPSKLTGDGKVILADKIKAASKATAKDAFDAFTTEVGKINDDVNKIKTSAAVNGTDLQTFMSNFKFEGGKFVPNGSASAISLNAIADNLVVYLKDDLAALKMEVEKVSANVTDAALLKTLTDAEKKLDEAIKATKAATDATAAATDAAAKQKAADEAKAAEVIAKNEFETAKKNAIDEARKQAIAAVLSKLITTPAPSTPTALKDLLDALNKYHIKTEYNYAAADPSGTSAASATVKYSIATSAVSAGDPKITSTPLAITAADIDNDKIFVPQFIDTKNALAKDVFVAISEKCTDADANACFKAILTKLSTDFAKTVGDVLSTVVPEKKVSQTEFNNVFDSFNTLVPVDVAEDDIKTIDDLVTVENGNCKIKLHYLSNDEKPFDNYIAWLENEKLKSATVADKTAAVNAFFTILKDNLAAYKTKLEKDLKSAEVKQEENPDDKKLKAETEGNGTEEQQPQQQPQPQQQQSNAQPTPKTGMSKTTKIIIIVGGVVGGFLILSGIGFFTYWYSYSTKSSGVV